MTDLVIGFARPPENVHPKQGVDTVEPVEMLLTVAHMICKHIYASQTGNKELLRHGLSSWVSLFHPQVSSLSLAYM